MKGYCCIANQALDFSCGIWNCLACAPQAVLGHVLLSEHAHCVACSADTSCNPNKNYKIMIGFAVDELRFTFLDSALVAGGLHCVLENSDNVCILTKLLWSVVGRTGIPQWLWGCAFPGNGERSVVVLND